MSKESPSAHLSYSFRTFLELFGLASLALVPLLIAAYRAERNMRRKLMQGQIDRQNAAAEAVRDA